MSSTNIARIDFRPLDLRLTEPFAIAGGAQARADIVVVEVTLADGTTGLGEAAPFTAVSGETRDRSLAAARTAGPALVGRDVDDWRAIGRDLGNLGPLAGQPAARCALEMAVLDAFAKAHAIPLWSFFGGAGTEVETDMTITAGDEAHAAAAARGVLGRGIGTIKLKVGGLEPRADAARLRAVHHAHPSAVIFADANGGYTLPQAHAFLDAAAAMGVALALFEQPVAADDWNGLAELAKRGDVPIAADESAQSADDVHRIAELGAARVVNLKTMKSGVVETLAMASVARAAGIGLMIGGMVESILSMTFSVHLAAGLGGFSWVDLDTPMFIAEHPFEGGFRQTGGLLSVAHVTAGHGVEMNGARRP